MEDIKNFSFSVKHQNKNYRVGLIQTHRGEINTPAFMPVGTQATVKGVFSYSNSILMSPLFVDIRAYIPLSIFFSFFVLFVLKILFLRPLKLYSMASHK